MSEQQKLFDIKEYSQESLNHLEDRIGFKIPIDGLMTVALGKKTIDILKFDKQMKRKYPDYFHSGLSLIEFLENEFDEECVRIFNFFTF